MAKSRPMPNHQEPQLKVQRVQTGVRIEKRLLKVLKAVAEYHDLSLGDLVEGIVLHAFEGRSPFGPGELERIEMLKQIYNLDYDAGFWPPLCGGGMTI